VRLPLLILLVLTLSIGPAWADEPMPEPAVEPAPAPKRVDDLGREFPLPELLRLSRTRIGFGVGFTVAGSAMLVGGLFLGSGFARGELVAPVVGNLSPGQSAAIPTLGLFGGGMLFAFVGVPTLSAGIFMNKQLLRTIKGAEKVPRVVANEERYWNAYLGKMFAQTLMVAGGGEILLGTLAVVAVGALISTDRYKPLYWFIPGGLFATGGTMLAGGLALSEKSKEQMNAVFDEVDPMRQKQALLYSLGPAVSVTHHGPDEVRASFGWTFAF
jgi:hypothetical protein